MGFFEKSANFFKEVRQELKKVTWPTRQEALRYTIAVVGISIAVAIFLGASDFLFSLLLNKFIIQ